MNANVDLFQTSDLGLAAALFACGFSATSVRKDSRGKATFAFIQSKDLSQTVSAFWDDKLQINPRQYFHALKDAKTRIYA